MFKKIIDGIRGKNKIPENLEECFVWLDKYIRDKEEFKMMPEDKAISSTHSTFGRWIRNEWGLWSDSNLAEWFRIKGIQHADDMSSIILTSYHRKLNNKDIKFVDQAEYFRNYWRELDFDRFGNKGN